MYADSLLRKIELQAGYMDIMRDIIKGNIKPDSLLSLDSVQLKETATDYLEKSKKEKEFIEKYEREEKYNLSTIESKTNDNICTFSFALQRELSQQHLIFRKIRQELA
jgi:hypothetical protein